MKKIVLFIKGIVIGIATLVPGVSGGTMAIILGVYDKMISSVSSFFKHIKQNTIFLGILACGGVLGIGLFSRLIKFCLTEFKMPTIYLFLGIITGGIPLLYKKTNSAHNHKKNYLYFVIGLGLIIIMTFYKGTIINLAKSGGILNYLFLLLAGIIVAIALILPGISTSFMLLTLGLYDITINAINNLEYNFLIPLIIGIGIGVITTTKVLEHFLVKKPSQTYMLILGFVLGSIIEVFPGLPQGLDILFSVITFILGFIIILFMSKKYSE